MGVFYLEKGARNQRLVHTEGKKGRMSGPPGEGGKKINDLRHQERQGGFDDEPPLWRSLAREEREKR